MKKSKRAQEEMIGFALIIVLVAVILLVFLGISMRNSQKEAVESYEVRSFIRASLQYTSDCEDYLGYLSVQEMIYECDSENVCLDERDSCEVLNSTLKELIEEGWKVVDGSPIKGYELKIIVGEEELIILKKGNITNNCETGMQTPPDVKVFFTVCS